MAANEAEKERLAAEEAEKERPAPSDAAGPCIEGTIHEHERSAAEEAEVDHLTTHEHKAEEERLAAETGGRGAIAS